MSGSRDLQFVLSSSDAKGTGTNCATLCGKFDMPNLSDYMARYDHEHTSAWNKILHAVGIPAILAGVVLLILTFWLPGLVLFAAGWVLLFIGHRIEGNNPAFFQGPVYFLVGPLWVAKEIKDHLFGHTKNPSSVPQKNPVADSSSAAADSE